MRYGQPGHYDPESNNINHASHLCIEKGFDEYYADYFLQSESDHLETRECMRF